MLTITAYFDVCHCSLAEGVLHTYITAHVIHKTVDAAVITQIFENVSVEIVQR